MATQPGGIAQAGSAWCWDMADLFREDALSLGLDMDVPADLLPASRAAQNVYAQPQGGEGLAQGPAPQAAPVYALAQETPATPALAPAPEPALARAPPALAVTGKERKRNNKAAREKARRAKMNHKFEALAELVSRQSASRP